MTLPAERTRAVLNVRKYLISIIHGPNAPDFVKSDVRSLLKHYPNELDMRIASEKAPEVFGLVGEGKDLERCKHDG